MSATFGRIKVWVGGEVLTASDLNAEFDNILQNLSPAGISSVSEDINDMRATTDPYPGGVEYLAPNLREEIKSIRYLIRQITGKSQWYIDPDVSLSNLSMTSTPIFAGLKLTGLTPGYVPYKGVGALADSPIYIGGINVGIGTTTPGYSLDVSGETKSTGGFLLDKKTISLTTAPTWLRFAVSKENGDSNAGIFEIRWERYGIYGHIIFSAAANYNDASGINLNLLGGSSYGPQGITKIRLLRNTTYDLMYLELYAAYGDTTSPMSIEVRQLSGYGWNMLNIVDGSIPAGYTAHELSTSGAFAVNEDSKTFMVTKDGKVGIGTTAPIGELTVHGGELTVHEGKILSQVTGDVRNILLNQLSGTMKRTQIVFKQGGADQFLLGVDSGLTNTRDFFIFDSVAGATRLLIDPNGKVGIGTTAPSATLHVVNSSTTAGALETVLGRAIGNTNFWLVTKKGVTTNNPGDIVSKLGLAYSGTTDNAFIRFHRGSSTNNGFLSFSTNNDIERVRITNSGNVGIGVVNPYYQLHLSQNSAGKPVSAYWDIDSDERIKKNIVPADLNRCYEIVKNIPLVHYSWDDGLYDEQAVKDRSRLGWIAQQVEPFFPKAITTHKVEYMQEIEDGVEEYEEHEYISKMVDVKRIEVIDGVPTEIIVKEEQKEYLYDEVQVVDKNGNTVLDENGNPKMHKKPRMIKKTRPKMRPIKTIEDCKGLDIDQIMKALYGAVQLLINKVEKLEAKAKNK